MKFHEISFHIEIHAGPCCWQVASDVTDETDVVNVWLPCMCNRQKECWLRWCGIKRLFERDSVLPAKYSVLPPKYRCEKAYLGAMNKPIRRSRAHQHTPDKR